MSDNKPVEKNTSYTERTWNFLQVFLPISVTLIANFILGSSFYNLLFGVIILSTGLYLILKIYFKKPLTFTLIFFCAVGLFPVFHCILYKLDRKSYRVEEDFANYNLRAEKDILNKFKDSNLIRSMDGENINIIDSLPLKLFTYKNLKFYTDENIENIRKYGPIGVPRERSHKLTLLNISDSFDNIILSDTLFPDKSLRFYFLRYLNDLNESKKRIENSGHLSDRDIWVESVSGFLFGDIKTVSTLAKLIRLVHLVFVYYLILMISKVIEKKKWLDLKP